MLVRNNRVLDISMGRLTSVSLCLGAIVFVILPIVTICG